MYEYYECESIIYVAPKFVNQYRDIVPQNTFSTVRPGGQNVQLAVSCGLEVVSEQRINVLRSGLS